MKFKRCSLCGYKCTDLKLARCPECKRGNIANVKIEDDEVSNTPIAPLAEPRKEQNELTRVGDNCDTKIIPNSRKCVNCNEDISDIRPTPSEESSSGAVDNALVSVDGKFTFSITKPI